jgi:hypothetical protein
MIGHLESALDLADELTDSLTGYLIERALDEARSHMVGGVGSFDSGLPPKRK